MLATVMGMATAQATGTGTGMATEVHPDGTTTVHEHVVADDPGFDCFYIYPTVDLRLAPGQTENFNDISQELDPLLNQAARFTSMCRMFAPLYHQVTIGTFSSSEAETLLDAAYQDDRWQRRRPKRGARRWHVPPAPLCSAAGETGCVLAYRSYASRCETDVDGNRYLAIGVEPGTGDVRHNPIDFGQPLLNPGLLGLHVFDYNFALGDLLELVKQASE